MLIFTNHHQFEDFCNRISQKLHERPTRQIERKSLKDAAVLIPLFLKDNAPHILVTKRTTKVATHKGEVSLPGGGIDENDRTPLDTALRETYEEVGIKPEDVTVLGEFDHFISIYGFHVYTFVGTIPYPYTLTINHDEIESYTEVPLSLFVEEKYDSMEYYTYEGNQYAIYYYHYNGYTIWGLTARILTDFSRKIIKDIMLLSLIHISEP
ncbi:MAG: CoA pyrophosphatase, partial [Spirochaetes bacterium]|nr:CoA pyrophosphatase [Spirochaetota bacterium]